MFYTEKSFEKFEKNFFKIFLMASLPSASLKNSKQYFFVFATKTNL